MRGVHFWGAGFAIGVLGNGWCWKTGRETFSQLLRRVPEPVVDAALERGKRWFLRHLYG